MRIIRSGGFTWDYDARRHRTGGEGTGLFQRPDAPHSMATKTGSLRGAR